MRIFRNKQSGQLFAWLAAATIWEATGARSAAVYSPEDNPHAIFVRAEADFYDTFEEVSAVEIRQLRGSSSETETKDA